jgi:superfamily I DNA/RNA helicase
MLTPTPEQEEIIKAAKTTDTNLIISALAGSAKTTTLEFICNAITGIPILSLAFNKRIALEMQKRLPSHVQARTLNSLGHEVWSRAINKRLTLDTGKSYNILRTLINDLPKSQQPAGRESMAAVLGHVRRAKRDGFVPQRWASIGNPIFSDFDEWLDTGDEQPDDLERKLTLDVLDKGIEAAYAGGIDFDDQIYMPVIFGGQFPKYPLVLIDEFQDLNELQHEMLAKLYHRRLIGVGDPYQSIYAFRGAKQNGMLAAKERWDMYELPLSVTFRVPKRGVERAWSRVPHMKWFEGAEDGRVEVLETWNANSIPDHSAIICRNNAPLFSCALKLLASGRAIKLVGMDIGAGLVRIIRKLGPLEGPADQGLIDKWMQQELKRAKRQETVFEKADCLRVLTKDHETLGQAIKHAEALFKQEGPIQLLSGHKSKGLEWETVFHLDPWRIPSRFAKGEDLEQEMNVRYVIETRFKKELFLVDLETFDG